jgi:predicted transcriptional regulator
MLTKENIITTINNLPEPLAIDDILDKILLLEKIDKGMEQSENGQVISDDDLSQKLDAWLV